MPPQKTKKQLAGLKIRQQMLYILIFSFVTVLVWVGVSIFTSQHRTEISAELLEMAKPLNPTINTIFLNEIEQKRSFGEEELSNFPIVIMVKSDDGRTEEKIVIDAFNSAEQVQADLRPTPSPDSFE